MDAETLAMPKSVRARGFSFFLQGWNSVFRAITTETASSSMTTVEYRMDPYKLYHIFPVVGLTISKRTGQWAMYSDADGGCSLSIEQEKPRWGPYCHILKLHQGGQQEQITPLGVWGMGITVEECPDTNTSPC